MKYIRKKYLLNEGADPTLGGVSYDVQGTPGYVYKIMDLNHDLEQKPNEIDDNYYIYPGCMVRGVGVNNRNLHYTGVVNRIVKNSNGEIQYLYIRCPKTNKMVTILADENLKLIIHDEKEYHGDSSYQITPSYDINKL